MPGLARIVQEDFSGGMWPQPFTPERIPANGAYHLENLLIDDMGGLLKRGGTALMAGSTWPTSRIIWGWEGNLAGGTRMVVSTTTTLYLVTGSGVSPITTYAGMANGPLRPAAIGGTLYLPGNVAYDGSSATTPGISQPFMTSVANRLVVAAGDQLNFSAVGDASTFGSTDFWKVPDGANTFGLATLRDSVVWFTNRGVYVVSNMALNLTDPDGNVQQRLDLYAPELTLWGLGATGVASHDGGLVIAARDGVWVMRLGVTSEAAQPLQMISQPIDKLYRDAVGAGYFPGVATVNRGHYFLPILQAPSMFPVAVWVCKLNHVSASGRRTYPWTLFTGKNTMPMGASFTRADGSLAIATDLMGAGTLSGKSALATAAFLDPAQGPANTDADGAEYRAQLSTRAYDSGSAKSTVVKTRLRYDLIGDGTSIHVQAANGIVNADSTSPAAAAPATSGGASEFSWPVGQRWRSATFTFTQPEASYFAARSVEMFVRESGRQ